MTPLGIRLIVGLGNPGATYRDTRHNAGAWFVEHLVNQHAVQLKSETKFFGQTGEFTVAGQRVRLLIPSTYMNESGKAILALSQFYKIKPAEMLLAHDELDQPCGVAKLKFGGGHGGHNGLRDTIRVLGTSDFSRLRVGIGHPGDRAHVTRYVLSSPTRSEQAEIEAAVTLSAGSLADLVSNEWNRAVKTLHDQIKK